MSSQRREMKILLSTVIKENPNKNRTQQMEIYVQKAREYYEFVTEALYVQSSLDYTTCYNAIYASPSDIKEPKGAKKERENAIIEEYAIHLSTHLMDMILSTTGKRLKDSTGADCMKESGFIAKIGELVGENNIVGKKMTEADLQEIYKRNKDKPPSDEAHPIN